MKNSLFAAELIRRLGVYADKELLGHSVARDHGVLTIDESEALNDAVKKIIVASGLSDFVKVEHCEATELYPAMTYFHFDFEKMDAVPQEENLLEKKPVDRYYQLLQLPAGHPQCFKPFDKAHLPEISAYEKVYAGTISAQPEWEGRQICEILNAMFNRDDRPNAGDSRALSTSDIIVLDGDKFFFCDVFGFTPISGATGEAEN